ncbi:FAD-dependent oxidoreductase [Flavobacterium tegetincola]|uniref:FAD-dependent oxidoreductase n=1 Tax=Flavobacterium tegetincola TaxID=150172 RepID=UPI000421FB89|nr:FAD-dependent oxidoreductase [Flavobacterium tegetincola]
MKKTKLVVIGGDAAGMSAASKVRREQPDFEIIVFEKSEYTSYSACGIPYFISGKVEELDELIVRSPTQFIEKYNIQAKTLHEVLEVDTDQNRILVCNRKDKTQFWESYDALLIATGGKAFCPEVKNHTANGIFGIQTLTSGSKVDTFLKKHQPKSAVIIGGGYIGLEMAEALILRGMKVTIVDRAPEVMSTLDPDMGKKVHEALENLGVEIFNSESLDHFEEKDGLVSAVVTDKQTIKTNLVILGMGTAPNTSFLINSNIELSEKKAIKVNDKQQTNVKNVWSAGDCAETLHLVSNKPFYIALGTVANKTGLVAGTNIAGGDLKFPGVVATAVCKICVHEIARTGLLEKECVDLKIDFVSTIIKSKTRAHYYPEAKDIFVKLIAEKGTGKLLGGQIIGEEGAAKRIDVLATALTYKLTLQNIIDLDLSYAPPFSPVWDPVQTAARKLIGMI